MLHPVSFLFRANYLQLNDGLPNYMKAQEGESIHDYDADLVGNITLFFLELRTVPINDS